MPKLLLEAGVCDCIIQALRAGLVTMTVQGLYWRPPSGMLMECPECGRAVIIRELEVPEDTEVLNSIADALEGGLYPPVLPEQVRAAATEVAQMHRDLVAWGRAVAHVEAQYPQDLWPPVTPEDAQKALKALRKANAKPIDLFSAAAARKTCDNIRYSQREFAAEGVEDGTGA